nr:hypothetical protein [Allomuricauda sp.]
MKYHILLLGLMFQTALFAQETIVEKELPEKFSPKNAYQITNRNSNEFALFLDNEYDIVASLFDEAHNEISDFTAATFPSDYPIPIGAVQTGAQQFQFFLSNRSKKKFGLFTFDFGQKSAQVQDIDLGMKKETFLQTFNHNGKFHILTIPNNSSIFNFYVFNADGTFTKNSVDLSSKRFRYWNNDNKDLYTLMKKPFGKEVPKLLEKIDATTPNSLEISAVASKLFLEEDFFYFTFESNRNITQVIKLDPTDFSYTVTTYNKPFLANVVNGKKTNSFLYNGNYLGVSSTNQMLKFEIKDLETRAVKKTYVIEKDKPINFKNTPIRIEGKNIISKSRSIENSNRFLRDMANNELGVTIYKDGETNVVSIGTFAKGKMAIPLVPVAAVQFGFLNVTGYAYFNVSVSESTYFKSLFNTSFDHLDGEIPVNSFESIKEYTEELGKLKLESVFRINGDIVLGYLGDDHTYRIIKF